MRLCFQFKTSKSNPSDTERGAVEYVSITKKANIIVRRYTQFKKNPITGLDRP